MPRPRLERVDVISQALAGLRVGRGTVRRFRRSGPWGLRYAGLTGSGFHVILRGGAWLVTEDAPPVALRPGDVVLITAGADHGLGHAPCELRELPPVVLGSDPPDEAAAPADCEFLCGAYRLDRGQVHPYLAALPDPLVLTPDPARFPAVASVVALLDETSPDQAGADATRAALLDLMLTQVLRQWLENMGEEDRRGWHPALDPAIAAALRAMHERPGEQWTVSRLGATAGMSRTAFTRRFTAAVGTPPMTYLREWRLGCAARLLRESDASLAATARRTGYATEYAFATAFRRRYGLSPGRFRQAERAGGTRPA